MYLRDIGSYRGGVSYDSAAGRHHAVFTEGAENEVCHIHQFEKALDVLLACSLRRGTRLSRDRPD